ncbi:primosomal protein N' [Flavobacterium piscinae]|uniref:Replication restart protein PriA n=1 Tax=Flavobacterium piscinae TaxID=2506424 RepID=A0A4Q1KFT7_9FLAO|nr:primosomal protein N' [Flavobacterium piscinae]RXR28302.1 primosomal protein N' [Flavobacterium piscinae]
MSHFVEVILPLALDKTFTYQVSETEYKYIKPGMRIAVPFGKSKMYTALAIETHQNPPTLYEAKEIHQILDENAIVNEVQLKHWQWIASYYMCSIGEVYRAALPSGFLLESETVISLKQGELVDEKTLTDDEFLVFEALQYQSSLKVNDVVSILNKKNVLPLLQKLIDKSVVSLQEEIHESYKPKLVKYIKLHENFSTDERLNELLNSIKAEKQKELLLGYFQLHVSEKKPISAKQLIDFTSSNSSVLKKLIEKEVFEEYHLIQDRTDFNEVENAKDLTLSQSQQKALDEIKNHFTTKDICLLHGVTSSGKTEIYSKLIQETMQTGKQILFLLPEIALTTQLVSRLRKFFGNKVAVFHSKYNNNERVEVWNQVLQNSPKAQVVIGARSAMFLPFSELGLVIVDEEHEQNFKQTDPAPRYHARDAVTVLAKFHQAKVLLGSATPSLETYYNVENQKYALVELFERYNNTPLPEVILVDLKDSYFRKRMNGHFSDTLIEEITTALTLGEQVILFQNRRGYAPLLECMTCGHIPQCPNCDVSLTYHKFKNQLRCHYCGHSIAKPTHCHQCSSVDLTTKGFGTEQIELELATLFPNKKIQRMDQDTTRGKFGYDKIIDKFQNREVDILVGTQMLAKGLDFDNVSLVGILNADNMLYFPDFRAFERSYQMMAQVSGRAGRADKRGKVVIQTYNPNHNTIQQVTHNNYIGMFKEQLYERQIFKYPPFFKLIKITLRHKEYEKVKESSMWLYQVLSQQLKMPVLGPEEPAVSKIRNEYIRTIVIKIPDSVSLQGTKKTIQKVLNSFDVISQYRSVKLVVNVDFG